jgi:hypothetical protein
MRRAGGPRFAATNGRNVQLCAEGAAPGAWAGMHGTAQPGGGVGPGRGLVRRGPGGRVGLLGEEYRHHGDDLLLGGIAALDL